jgi:Pectate lyase superfamily protein
VIRLMCTKFDAGKGARVSTSGIDQEPNRRVSRRVFGLGLGAAGGVGALAVVGAEPAEANTDPSTYSVDVKTYGAKGDGVTDDSDAIRAAVAAAISGRSGGVAQKEVFYTADGDVTDARLNVNGVRFEPKKSANQKIIDCDWNRGNVTFTSCSDVAAIQDSAGFLMRLEPRQRHLHLVLRRGGDPGLGRIPQLPPLQRRRLRQASDRPVPRLRTRRLAFRDGRRHYADQR